MTLALDAEIAGTAAVESDAKAKRKQREQASRELEAMSRAMIEEEGLLNHAQAGLLLDVSVKRVGELVRLGKLRRFDFLGRTYVSVSEIRDRRNQDLKAGRPKRNFLQSVATSLKAAAKTDLPQAKLGGFAGPYEKAKAKKRRK